MADIDVDQATRAMFRLGEQGMAAGALEDSAELLFADTVKREEYAGVLSREGRRGEEGGLEPGVSWGISAHGRRQRTSSRRVRSGADRYE